MLSLKKYMSFLWDDCQWEKLLHIAEKWPTGHGTLFYPLVRSVVRSDVSATGTPLFFRSLPISLIGWPKKVSRKLFGAQLWLPCCCVVTRRKEGARFWTPSLPHTLSRQRFPIITSAAVRVNRPRPIICWQRSPPHPLTAEVKCRGK